MAAALGDRRLRRRQEADRISDLPDDLLHRILHRVASTPAAARTSVLSRRWRRLWTDLTELRLDSVLAPVPGIGTVDGALGACCVPTVTRLRVSLDHLPPWGGGISADRVAHWLRFASRRVAGDLSILLPPAAARGAVAPVEEDLHLPVCERVTEITLWLGDRFWLRMPAAGAFSALTYVNIRDARMDSSELEEFVSRGCPRLEKLAVRLSPFLAESVVCIRSDTLRRLDFHIKNTRLLEVAAPMLEQLSMSNAVKAYIAAPELREIAWEDNTFNPVRHQFTETGRHLRRLVLALSASTAALLQRFDSVNELMIDILIPHGANGYKSFLKNVDMLPSSFSSGVCCISSGDVLVNILCRLSSCPCDSPKICRTNDIYLDSLDEVEINLISDEASSDAQAEYVELLLGCNAPMLKNVVISMSCACPFIRGDMCEKISEICLRGNKFEFSVVCMGDEWEESCSTVVIHISAKRSLAVELLTFASLLENEICDVH